MTVVKVFVCRTLAILPDILQVAPTAVKPTREKVNGWPIVEHQHFLGWITNLTECYRPFGRAVGILKAFVDVFKLLCFFMFTMKRRIMLSSVVANSRYIKTAFSVSPLKSLNSYVIFGQHFLF